MVAGVDDVGLDTKSLLCVGVVSCGCCEQWLLCLLWLVVVAVRGDCG